MNNREFDNTRISSRDEIVVRRYFRQEREKVEWVDFEKRTINGYRAAEIVEYVKNEDNNQIVEVK